MSPLKLTSEQDSIIALAPAHDNVMAKAYAGSGKTKTLELFSHAMPKGKPALALAFNVRVKDELASRLPQFFAVKTMNGLGHSAWAKAIDRRGEIVDFKLQKIIRELCKIAQLDATDDQKSDIRELISAAMNAGMVPSQYPHPGLIPDTFEVWRDIAKQRFLDVNEQGIELARQVLIESISQGFQGKISFDDQVYLSALFGGVFPRFPTLLVDEAQDLSPLNHLQVRRAAAGRLIICGDPLQAIYAFRGADSASMSSMVALRPEWSNQTLSTTFRCPEIIVRRQRHHARGFTAMEGASSGAFFDHPSGTSSPSDLEWNWNQILALRAAVPESFGSGPVAILCRNNAPIVKLAFRLIRQKVGATVLGRDIGTGLVALSKRLFKEDYTPVDLMRGKVREWLDEEIKKAESEGHPERAAGIQDRGECLFAVLSHEGIRDAGDLRNALLDLFSPKSTAKVILSSIHKAKGLEFPLVIHLDPWRIPSKFAIAAAEAGHPGQLEQERNLLYVCETRVRHTLVHANGEDFE